MGFPHPKGEDDGNEEEEERLLDNVIESDDEQADTLTPDQIRKYIDENQRQGGRLDAYNGSSGACGVPELVGKGDTSSRGGLLHPPLVDEYDELFDEDFEVEPDNVVVGAKLRPAGAGHFASSSTAASVIGRDALNDWFDDDDDDSPQRTAIPIKSTPLAGQLGSIQAYGALSSSTTSLSSFGQTTLRGGPAAAIDADWSEALDSAWRAPAFEGLGGEEDAMQQGHASNVGPQVHEGSDLRNSGADASLLSSSGTGSMGCNGHPVAEVVAMTGDDDAPTSSLGTLQSTSDAVSTPVKLETAVEDFSLGSPKSAPQIFDIADDPDL